MDTPSQIRYFGLYPAIVVDVVDPDSLGRVLVRLPWLGTDGDSDVRVWATLLSPYASDGQGLMVLPERDTQVIVGFEAGDSRRAYVVGSVWNGKERTPEKPEAGNNIRVLKTRSGSVLEFDDTPGATKVTVSTRGGHRICLDDGAQSVELAHQNGCRITMTPAGGIELKALGTIDLTAAALNIHSGTSTSDGLINCTSLIASSAVVSPTYTPGAGNVW